MSISPVNSQAFKGLLIVPSSWHCSHKGDVVSNSPQLEVETDDIIEIDNTYCGETLIKYNDNHNKLCTHTYYHRKYNPKGFERSRILLAYAAAAANKDVIIKA